MEVTVVGLQNAGKTSLLRVLSVGFKLLCLMRPRANMLCYAGRRIHTRVRIIAADIAIVTLCACFVMNHAAHVHFHAHADVRHGFCFS